MKAQRHSSGAALRVVIVLLALGATGAFFVLKAPDRATEFAPGYSHASFAAIHPGLREEKVVARLGDPLSISSDDQTETWHYALPTTNPEHTTIRNVVFDRRLRTVTRVDQRTRFDYWSQLHAGGGSDGAALRRR